MTVSDEAVEQERAARALQRGQPKEQERAIKSGNAWLDLVAETSIMRRQGRGVTGIKIKGDFGSGGDYLVIVTRESGDESEVAFHGSENLDTLWARLVRRIVEGTLTWKVDQYG